MRNPIKVMTYAEAMSRLKEILSALESGDIDIDELEVTIKESDHLLQFCEGKLRGIEIEIKDESE